MPQEHWEPKLDRVLYTIKIPFRGKLFKCSKIYHSKNQIRSHELPLGLDESRQFMDNIIRDDMGPVELNTNFQREM